MLVHCFAGRSRSSTLVLAYLMGKHRMSLASAVRRLKSVRSTVRPNAGFILQLVQYEKELFGRCSLPKELVDEAARLHAANPRHPDVLSLATREDIRAAKAVVPRSTGAGAGAGPGPKGSKDGVRRTRSGGHVHASASGGSGRRVGAAVP